MIHSTSSQARNSRAAAFAWTAWFVVLAILALSLWMRSFLITDIPGPIRILWMDLVFWFGIIPLATPAYATVAAVILSRQPENKVGWMCLGLSLIFPFEDISWLLTDHTLRSGAGDLAMYTAWSNMLFTGLAVPPYFLTFMLYYFPNNRLPGRGWRIGVILGLVSLAAMLVSLFLMPNLYSASPDPIPNPFAIPGLGKVGEILNTLATVSGTVALLGSAASIIARWRKSNGVERAQIKWLATISVFLIIAVTGMVAFPPQPGQEMVWGFFLLFAASLITAALPAAVGIAVMRYKLWNIDQIIRRTLAYTIITGLLILVYFGSVVLLQQIFRAVTGDSSRLSVVISTLAIAALFNPVRQRVQMFIDQRFYRSRYDAVRTLATFSETARDLVELKDLADRLNTVVQTSMRPSRVGVWFKESERVED